MSGNSPNGLLRQVRTTIGMRQRDFADLLEIGESTLGAYERGEIPTPRKIMLAALAVAIVKLDQERARQARLRRPFG